MKKFLAAFTTLFIPVMFLAAAFLLFLSYIHNKQDGRILLISLLFAAAGTWNLLAAAGNAASRFRLRHHGTQVKAAVMSVTPNMHYMINGIPTFILTCTAEINGRSMFFTRKNLREPQIHNINDSVTVCYNKDNPDDYYIEL